MYNKNSAHTWGSCNLILDIIEGWFEKSDELTLLSIPADSYQFVTIGIEDACSSIEWFQYADSALGFVVFTKDQTISRVEVIYR